MPFKKAELKIDDNSITVVIEPFTFEQLRLLSEKSSPILPGAQHWIAFTSMGCFELTVLEHPKYAAVPIDEFERARAQQYASLLASPMENIHVMTVVRKQNLQIMVEQSGELLVSAYQPAAAVMTFNQEEYIWRFLISKGRCISLMESFSTPPCTGFGYVAEEYQPIAHSHCADIENPQ